MICTLVHVSSVYRVVTVVTPIQWGGGGGEGSLPPHQGRFKRFTN